MSWDDNNGPWGKPPSSSNRRNNRNSNHNNNEELDELLKKVKDFIPKGGKPPSAPQNTSKMLAIAAIVALCGWLATGFYTVDTKEEALVLRFGKQIRVDKPGLNYHLPFPIERKIKEVITEPRKEERIGKRSGSRQNNEMLVLTGDENIVDITLEVQWQVRDIAEFVFNVENPTSTVRNAAESAMREIIGTTPIDQILSSGRTTVQVEIGSLLQEILNSYEAGIVITDISLAAVPPSMVDDAFKDVQAARINQEETVNKAKTYSNRVTINAIGEAEKILQGAEAYKSEVVNRAIGETKRFLSVYNQYKLAKDVTKSRIYLETMEKVLQNKEKLVIDNEKGGILPYLSLNEIKRNTNQTN